MKSNCKPHKVDFPFIQLFSSHMLFEGVCSWMEGCGSAVNHVLWLPLIWITCRAHMALKLLWHCNLPIIWLTDSDWLCLASSFPSWRPCASVKAYQLSFGLAVYFCLLYKLNECFMHADCWLCLSGLFLHFIHLWRPVISTHQCLRGENSPRVFHTSNKVILNKTFTAHLSFK